MNSAKTTTTVTSIREQFHAALEKPFYENILPGHKYRKVWTLISHEVGGLGHTLMKLRLTLSWIEGNKVLHYTAQQLLQKILWYYHKYDPEDFIRRKNIIIDIDARTSIDHIAGM